MTTYWKYQKVFDIAFAALLTLFLIKMGDRGFVWFEYRPDHVRTTASEWLGAVLSLFGLVSATVAFVFSAIEGKEFTILREGKSRKQLWEVFSFTLLILFIASAWCVVMTLLSQRAIETRLVFYLSSFIVILSLIFLAKFTWVMTQIIVVKAG